MTTFYSPLIIGSAARGKSAALEAFARSIGKRAKKSGSPERIRLTPQMKEAWNNISVMGQQGIEERRRIADLIAAAAKGLPVTAAIEGPSVTISKRTIRV